MQEAKPLDQGLTFNPADEEEPETKPAKKSPKIQQIEDKWKDVYSEMGDKELEEIIQKAEALIDTYTFSNGQSKTYRPIKNRQWREMTAKRRQWQAIQAKDDNSSKTLAQLEGMIDDYYADMCNIFFGMTRDEYDDLPPSETIQAVEVCNHKTIHPLKGKKP